MHPRLETTGELPRYHTCDRIALLHNQPSAVFLDPWRPRGAKNVDVLDTATQVDIEADEARSPPATFIASGPLPLTARTFNITVPIHVRQGALSHDAAESYRPTALSPPQVLARCRAPPFAWWHSPWCLARRSAEVDGACPPSSMLGPGWTGDPWAFQSCRRRRDEAPPRGSRWYRLGACSSAGAAEELVVRVPVGQFDDALMSVCLTAVVVVGGALVVGAALVRMEGLPWAWPVASLRRLGR